MKGTILGRRFDSMVCSPTCPNLATPGPMEAAETWSVVLPIPVMGAESAILGHNRPESPRLGKAEANQKRANRDRSPLFDIIDTALRHIAIFDVIDLLERYRA